MATRPPAASSTHTTNGETHARGPPNTVETSTATPAPASTANRKKQKRRQKQAARLAAEHQSPTDGYASGDVADPVMGDDMRSYGDDRDYGESFPNHAATGVPFATDKPTVSRQNSTDNPVTDGPDEQHNATGRRSRRKRGKKHRSGSHTLADGSSTPLSTPSATFSHPPPAPQTMPYASRYPMKAGKEGSIWNQSSLEERENIRTFWFELGEEDRRQLVKVEKDAVLKKMKEQQKHSCSCTVCGRKRTAIEEELEVLYDAYYEELEQYANNNQGSFDEGSPIIPPPRLYQPPLRSPGQHTHTHGQFHPSRGRVQELPEDDDDLEEDYDEDEEDEDDDELYSDDELEDEEAREARADFFAFGNSLTVKDGILTVADDLLKNDGKHFIDMMEQLAERRMQREEDTQYGIAAAHQSFHGGHNHGPLDDEDYDDEEDEEYDSQEEDEYDEDEMDAMTEEQRMQEGRRMFQIFAARMFEQRVMTAYREKVAEQRQKQLIEELLEEETREEQKNAKKAREAQKKKDKKQKQKQAKDEEKARRDAEKAAEEAAVKAEQEKKLEEQRLKREEQRKKREAERKAQEEERVRKETEKQRRLKEERERQAEIERKQREQKELERKKREEAKRKEREEREAREKKAKEERERKLREAAVKAEQERAGRRDVQAKRALPAYAGAFPLQPNPQSPAQSNPLQSPHYAAANVVPKAPTPARPRQPSQQDSHSSSPRSQQASTDSSHQPSVSPHSIPLSQSSGASSMGAKQTQGQQQQPPLHHPQPSAPLSPLGRTNPPGFQGLGLPSHPPGIPGMVPRPPLGPDLPMYPPNSTNLMNQFRGFPAPSGISAPPGINGSRPIPPGRGFPLEHGPGIPFQGQPGLSNAFPMQQGGLAKTHSRQPSGSFERSPLENNSQLYPITRPSPIKRPPSTAQEQQRESGPVPSQREVDNLSAHLGSSALLDDTDSPYSAKLSQSLPGAVAPGSFSGPTRASFGGPSLFGDPLAPKPVNNFSVTSSSNTWGTPFGNSAFPGTPTWGTAPGSGWSHNVFGASSHQRPHTSRPVTIRLLVIQACKQLNNLSSQKGVAGYHDVGIVLRQVEQLRPSSEPSISLGEMLDICDTEGSPQNGGGSFSINENENGQYVKFEPDTNSAAPGHRPSIVPGDIGSPIPGHSNPAAFGGFGGPAPSVLRQYTSPPAGF
ncbi:uncharacterized protein PFLUO_LOCUS6838 [Penicillium psychrofluorescens]|uniref:uncharacterized protein n=1 Tax=Penicillium psychrofluorescens TaxID=3158075 RepID=UPI003CCD0FF9